MYDIIIIGGGTAGLTAAIYAARAGRRVLVLESAVVGGQITTSPRVENYPGIMQFSGMEFADRLYEQATALGVELELDRVHGITDNGHSKTVTCDGASYEAGAVIIATGAQHRKLGAPGEERLAGHGVSYCAICDGAFFRGKTVAVIGGGSAALVSGELLADGCAKVYLVHRRDEFRGEMSVLSDLEKRENVEIVRSAVVDAIEGENKVAEIVLRSTKDGAQRRIPCDGVFIAVGQSPENEAFSGLIDLDAAGYVVAGEDTKTTCDGVFAAGDCRTKEVRQLTTAAADGAVAALAACDYLRTLGA